MFNSIFELLETPTFHKFKAAISKKGLDSSLEIKKDYLKESLIRVKTTKAEAWEMKINFLTQILNNLASMSKFFAGDFLGSISAMARSF
jgi:hypothetical protein